VIPGHRPARRALVDISTRLIMAASLNILGVAHTLGQGDLLVGMRRLAALIPGRATCILAPKAGSRRT
jgi:hypothetical protein